MNRRKGIVAVIVPILLLSSFLTLSQAIPPAHGTLTRIVCIADPTGSKCPENPALLAPTSPSDKQLTISRFVNTSAPLDGFGILLVSDLTITKHVKGDM